MRLKEVSLLDLTHVFNHIFGSITYRFLHDVLRHRFSSMEMNLRKRAKKGVGTHRNLWNATPAKM